ncbi:MAG TPA: HD domain-containing phosphohydrolase [Dehalococcoidia bacterium]|nr:HD domain-containing phosphohydrolase [Dehalococcoidia bacterium]
MKPDGSVLEWRASLGAEHLVPKRIPPLSIGELALATSLALDLAEGRSPGHAQRVCYIGLSIASHAGFDAKQTAGVFYGALMHDLGVPFITPLLTQRLGLDEDKIFSYPANLLDKLLTMLPEQENSAVSELIASHAERGAESAEDLKLPPAAVTAIRSHHEHWDGSGTPAGMTGSDIPVEARTIAIAHIAESVLGAHSSSLSARNSLAAACARLAGSQLDDELTRVFERIIRRDSFWLAYYDDGLAELLSEARPADSHKRSRRITMDYGHTFADVIDAKCGYAPGHSARCADLARRLALSARLDDGHADLVWWATLMRDVGHLGVPSRIMAKSDILSIEEMQVVQLHPTHSRMVVESLPGMSDVARWVGMHHEWPDGKGYPDSLSADEIPLEAKIISVVDVFNALTSDRPYRETLDRDGAFEVIQGASGSQLDSDLVGLLRKVV